MKKICPVILAGFVGLAAACNQASQEEKGEAKEKPVLVGSDDSSTGYTWSEVKGKKIRIFEAGERLHSTTDSLSSFAAYLVFKDDSSQVELFLPDNEKARLLDRRQRPDGTPVWNVEDDDTYLVEPAGKEWLVSRRGKLYYATSGTAGQLPVTFANREGKNIQAVFYQGKEYMELSVDGQSSILRQYRTASGYGYKNALYDLRGKGQAATLTILASQEKIDLQEK